MKKFRLPLLALAAMALATPAWAIKPFSDAFVEKYVKEGSPLAAKVAEAKCNVCHMGKDKKPRNEYGKALEKLMKKGDYTGDNKKFDLKTPEGKAEIDKQFAAAEAEKSASGKTFGELIKAGELPAAP